MAAGAVLVVIVVAVAGGRDAAAFVIAVVAGRPAKEGKWLMKPFAVPSRAVSKTSNRKGHFLRRITDMNRIGMPPPCLFFTIIINLPLMQPKVPE